MKNPQILLVGIAMLFVIGTALQIAQWLGQPVLEVIAGAAVLAALVYGPYAGSGKGYYDKNPIC